MSKFLKPVLCAAVLVLPISVYAQDHKGDDRQDKHGSSYAYYDSKHRDWHKWDDQENQAYAHYAEEHHQQNHDFSSASEREQQQYWNWKHKHPDSH